ncbi:hypothetical protein IA57_04045 [Mangrovimonas yunxiaonensis]|uniref:Uncharacterized protein n=1 Tax=Mangrovimonas yunxiaonensis TaxID=1197477 RepID=A0A084TMV5_9FLAO|nr:hypothetical protein [Mangrovimonas yunxiaonensis]KFB02041.1 hypothetical protein IA57_04045 [Mangrovimonas yunxiaonensis]GGH45501.1 hypothetical protein GCM10011364_18960 [Mangrovimonas yunxiaonensis]
MTYKESKRIDLILSEFLKEDRIEISSSINEVNFVKKGRVHKLTETELKKLLHLIKKEQTAIGIELITGHDIIHVEFKTISDFLADGGFEKIIRKRLTNKTIKITTFVLSVFTFLILFIKNIIIDPIWATKTEKIIQEPYQQHKRMEKQEIKSTEQMKPNISKKKDSSTHFQVNTPKK